MSRMFHKSKCVWVLNTVKQTYLNCTPFLLGSPLLKFLLFKKLQYLQQLCFIWKYINYIYIYNVYFHMYIKIKRCGTTPTKKVIKNSSSKVNREPDEDDGRSWRLHKLRPRVRYDIRHQETKRAPQESRTRHIIIDWNNGFTFYRSRCDLGWPWNNHSPIKSDNVGTACAITP